MYVSLHFNVKLICVLYAVFGAKVLALAALDATAVSAALAELG